jgi:hypothetical protein
VILSKVNSKEFIDWDKERTMKVIIAMSGGAKRSKE